MTTRRVLHCATFTTLVLSIFVSSWSMVLADSPPIRDLQARTLVTIPFGPGGIPEWQPGDPGNGLPISFCFDAEGRVHLLIPHDRSIIVRHPSSGEIEHIPLTTREGAPLSARSYLGDMAMDATGNYYVLDTTGGSVLHFDPSGRAVASFGHILGGVRIEYEPADDSLAVRDAADGAINRFSPGGSFLGFVRDPALVPVGDSEGRYVRTAIIGLHRAFLWLRDRASAIARLFTLVEPQDPSSTLYQVEPLAWDSENHLLVLTVETDQEEKYMSYLYRFTPRGTLESIGRLPANQEFASDLPRFYRVIDDTTLVTFATTENTYRLVAYE